MNFYQQLKIDYETDPYLCPYDATFPDVYSNFLGCLQPLSPTRGFPCVVFNEDLGICTRCLDGYELRSGSCYVIKNCPSDRYYYHYGQCFLAAYECASFNQFSGECLTCIS